MNSFEFFIDKTLQPYRDEKKANLIFLHPPMRPAGMLGHVPCFIQTGKAPFDLAGIYYDKAGTSIGAELKETQKHESSLSIIGPGKKGGGLQYHQLVSLHEVYTAGGVALLLWSNGGEIGVLDGQGIALAFVQYETSLKAQSMGKTPAKGARSILWGRFRKVKYGHNQLPLWLPASPVVKGAA